MYFVKNYTLLDAKYYAELLKRASESKVAIPPLSVDIGITDLDLAYQIQRHNTIDRIDNGARVLGKKIGLTSLAVQKQLGVDQPDFGVLFDDMELLNGLSVSMKELMQPKAEAEIAFVLGDDLDMDNISIIDLLSAIDYALPAIEIVGSRIENWNIKITDTIADNASASHFVLGHKPSTLDEIDLVNCKMIMKKNEEVVSQGIGAACLGSPLNAALWLARKSVSINQPLEAGEIILSGALGPMTNLDLGDEIFVEIDGLGSVSIKVD